jgi:hypothetical protein
MLFNACFKPFVLIAETGGVGVDGMLPVPLVASFQGQSQPRGYGLHAPTPDAVSGWPLETSNSLLSRLLVLFRDVEG